MAFIGYFVSPNLPQGAQKDMENNHSACYKGACFNNCFHPLSYGKNAKGVRFKSHLFSSDFIFSFTLWKTKDDLGHARENKI